MKVVFKYNTELENIKTTWFIDSPYQSGGQYYIHNEIDYKQLSEWCLIRKGQIIVCENSRANWLPFKSLIQINGQRKKTTEVVFNSFENY